MTGNVQKPEQPVLRLSEDQLNDEKMIIVKGNILIDSWFDVTLSEYMLIQSSLYLISQKNEKNEIYDANTRFRITIEDYCKLWGYNNKTGIATHNLKDIGVSIMQKGFWYKSLETHKSVFSYWFSEISPLENGAITFSFPPSLIPYLKQVNKKFTWYDFKQIKKLRKVYAIRIYELLSQNKYAIGQSSSNAYVSNNEYTITVEELRARFVLQKKYKIMADFRKRVIDEPVQQINDETDLQVTATPVRNGKQIVAFKFKYTFPDRDLDFKNALGVKDKEPENTKRDPDTIDIFHNLTDKQLKFFTTKLCSDHIFGSTYADVNESLKDFENRIYNKLKCEPDFILKIQKDLIRVGFDPKFAINNKKK